MIINNNELQALRRVLDDSSGIDPDLYKHCSDSLHAGKYDDAVRNAFVFLEEKLRAESDNSKLYGTKLVDNLFNPDNGVLAKKLGKTKAEQDGLRELFSGAFKLFRNPTAHNAMAYSEREGKSIIALVNLLVFVLDKPSKRQFFGSTPLNLQNALMQIEQAIGKRPTDRLLNFIEQSVDLGLQIDSSAKKSIPFKYHTLIKYDTWPKARIHPLPIFYVYWESQILWFPVNGYYRNVVGLDVTAIQQSLMRVGLKPQGKSQDFAADMKNHNSASFFEQLTNSITQIVNELERLAKQASVTN